MIKKDYHNLYSTDKKQYYKIYWKECYAQNILKEIERCKKNRLKYIKEPKEVKLKTNEVKTIKPKKINVFKFKKIKRTKKDIYQWKKYCKSIEEGTIYTTKNETFLQYIKKIIE